MRSSQLLVSKGQGHSPSPWRVTILAETATDSISNAADRALEEIANRCGYLKSHLTYRKEIVAESYMLGTVRAIHNITLCATAEEAIAFSGAFKNRIEALTRNNPSFRILEEDPKEWWIHPKIDRRLIDGQAPSNSLDRVISEHIDSSRTHSFETPGPCTARPAINKGPRPVGEDHKNQKRESFKWTPPMEFYREESGGGRLYRCRAITATITGNNDKFTREELILAARSLADRPINLNHESPLPYPDNKTLNAEYESHGVETIMRVRDEETNRLFDEDRIGHVSIEAYARTTEECDGIAPIGLVFTGLALLTDDVLPADPATTIELWEKTGEVSLAKIEEPGWFAKLWEKPSSSANESPRQQSLQKASESSDKTKVQITDPEQKAEVTKTKATGRISNWILLGITALLVLVLVIAKALTKNNKLCLEAKQAIARQHLALHSDKTAKIVGQGEVSSGTEFEFEADGGKFTVVIDDLGQVKSWGQAK
jgi:hypothetical protein